MPFSTGTFSSGSFYTGEEIVSPSAASPLIGGGYAYSLPQSRTQIRLARRRLGLEDDYRTEEELAQAVIADVAARQARTLERDEQKRFEELTRQLALERIEFRAAHLEALNRERERLIDLEIAKLLRKKLEDEEMLLMLLMVSAVAA